MAIAYGFRAYQLGIPKGASTEIFLLYIAFGAARILSYPVTLIIDRVPQKGNPKWIGWTIILILFWLAVLGAMFASGYAGFSAMMQHLASPP